MFDYEIQPSYTLEVTASDAVFQDVKNLTIYIDDVNEEPFFTAVNKLKDVAENETTSRVVLDMDASDPENDVLTYDILESYPTGILFSIDSSNGKFLFQILLYNYLQWQCNQSYVFSLYFLIFFMNCESGGYCNKMLIRMLI